MSSTELSIFGGGKLTADVGDFRISSPPFTTLKLINKTTDSDHFDQIKITIFGESSDFARFKRIAEAINAPEVEVAEAQSEET